MTRDIHLRYYPPQFEDGPELIAVPRATVDTDIHPNGHVTLGLLRLLPTGSCQGVEVDLPPRTAREVAERLMGAASRLEIKLKGG